jgi:hypothetical protein
MDQPAPDRPVPTADDTDPWLRPVWEDEPAENGIDPPAMTARNWPVRNQPTAAHGLNPSKLLTPMAEASAALARLDARLEAADPAVADGLRGRLALREAAGWLAHRYGTWVHPTDLGLREAGLTGSVTAAAMGGRLRAILPATLDNQAPPERLAEDQGIAQALHLGRLWLRLARNSSWTPLADAASLAALLGQLGDYACTRDAAADWLGRFTGRASAADVNAADHGLPALARAGLSAQAWRAQEPAQGRGDQLSTAAVFLAACLWRRVGNTPTVALPFWSATPHQLDALGRLAGPDWLAGWLGAVCDAVQRAGQDLSRLQMAAGRAAALRRTARSRLPAAAALALRQPVLTASGLAARLRITPQAALILLKQLVAAGVLREATGRAAWRAFVVA